MNRYVAVLIAGALFVPSVFVFAATDSAELSVDSFSKDGPATDSKNEDVSLSSCDDKKTAKDGGALKQMNRTSFDRVETTADGKTNISSKCNPQCVGEFKKDAKGKPTKEKCPNGKIEMCLFVGGCQTVDKPDDYEKLLKKIKSNPNMVQAVAAGNPHAIGNAFAHNILKDNRILTEFKGGISSGISTAFQGAQKMGFMNANEAQTAKETASDAISAMLAGDFSDKTWDPIAKKAESLDDMMRKAGLDLVKNMQNAPGSFGSIVPKEVLGKMGSQFNAICGIVGGCPDELNVFASDTFGGIGGASQQGVGSISSGPRQAGEVKLPAATLAKFYSKFPTLQEGKISGLLKNTKNIPTEAQEKLKNGMISFALVESRFDPYAKAKTSSARGLMQFLSGTWRGVMPGEALNERYNPEKAMEAAIKYVDQNWGTNNIGNLIMQSGIDPVAGSYVAHNQGPGNSRVGFTHKEAGAMHFLTAYMQNPNMPVSKVLPWSTINNNKPLYAGKTVGESVEAIAAKLSNTKPVTTFGGGVYYSGNRGSSPTPTSPFSFSGSGATKGLGGLLGGILGGSSSSGGISGIPSLSSVLGKIGTLSGGSSGGGSGGVSGGGTAAPSSAPTQTSYAPPAVSLPVAPSAASPYGVIAQESTKPTINLVVTPSTVKKGESGMIIWAVANARACGLHFGEQVIANGMSGAYPVDIPEETIESQKTYKLECISRDSSGTKVSTTTTIYIR